MIFSPPFRALATSATILLIPALVGCSGGSGGGPGGACEALTPAGGAAPRGVVLIVNDTMRRDSVGVYGGSAHTPAFDAFARENLLFDQAFTQAPWTKPAIATLFTSLYPSQHGLASHPALRRTQRRGMTRRTIDQVDVLGTDYVTLAETLWKGGYRTAAFVSNPWMDRGFGFEQGFELYKDDFGAGWNVEGAEVSRAALKWIDGLAEGERFFLYLHYIDSHRPYGVLDDSIVDELERAGPTERGAGADDGPGAELHRWLVNHPQQQLTDSGRARLDELEVGMALIDRAYDRGIEDFDRALGIFLDGLDRRIAPDTTTVWVTSDHGEAMFEHGFSNHGIGLFDEEVAIPLAARLPGVDRARGRMDCGVGLIDLMPTLCAYLGVDCPDTIYGRSLIALESGEPLSGQVIGEGVMFKPRNRSIRDATYKLLWEPDGTNPPREREHALFNLREDPGEQHDLLADGVSTTEHEQIGRRLTRALLRAVPEFDRPEEEFAPVDAKLEERLRALGYLD